MGSRLREAGLDARTGGIDCHYADRPVGGLG
jgi:hypothetical protein